MGTLNSVAPAPLKLALPDITENLVPYFCGLPCKHACSAIFWKGDNPEDYISNFYTPAAYMACYGPVVNPINGENLWPTTNMDKILPPLFRVKPGRPRKLRRREADETPGQSRLRKTGTVMKCRRCKQVGHNKATCKQPPPAAPSESAPPSTGSAPPTIESAQQTTGSAATGRGGGTAAQGRGRGGIGRGQGRGASSQPRPKLPTKGIKTPKAPPNTQ